MKLLPRVQTFRGPDGKKDLTRFVWGRLFVNVAHRPDPRPDPHDHPWNFWTFPFIPYREEVWTKVGASTARTTQWIKTYRWVWPFWIHRREATLLHRVVSPLVTAVWVSPDVREWGFLHVASNCWLERAEYFRKVQKMEYAP